MATDYCQPRPRWKGELARRMLGSLLTGELVREFAGSQTIPLEDHVIDIGLRVRIARDLVCQTAGADGVVYATRGYHLYRLAAGGAAFERVRHLPCPLTKAWMGHFHAIRQYAGRSDLVEMLPIASGALLVFSGGRIYRGEPGGKGFAQVGELRYWGPGVGRGVRPQGLLQTPDGKVYFSEYFRNPSYEPVRICVSQDDGRSWSIAHEFPAGAIRHIHSLQHDPFTGRLWVCTGDANAMSFVAWSDDAGGTFHKIGTGSQMWRVGRLVFTPEHVYWGADTNNPEFRCVYRWRRADGQVEKLAPVDGPVLGATRLAGGMFVLATDREGMAGMNWNFGEGQKGYLTEADEVPGLWISPDGKAWKRLPLAKWLAAAKPAFGIPQLASGDGAPVLAFTCLNMERYDDCLMLVPEDELARWFAAGGQQGSAR